MPEEQQNLTPEQKLDSYLSNLLEKYGESVKETTLNAARQALDDSIRSKEIEAIQEAFQEFKKESKQNIQTKLQEINRLNSNRIVERRSQLPQEKDLDIEVELETPSLELGIKSAYEQYGVLVSKEQDSLPEDLNDALDA